MSAQPMILSALGVDEPRVRLVDPPQSHAAADVSAGTSASVIDEIVRIVAEFGPLTGIELNDVYAVPGSPSANTPAPRGASGFIID